MTELIGSTRVKTARKTHYCRLCFAVAVLPGQSYTREAYVCDGSAYVWITCQPCDEIAADVDRWSWSEDGIGPDTYEEWARDHPEHPGAVAYLERRERAANR